MSMPQEAQAKKFALKRIKEYARAVEAQRMKQPTDKQNMEQADSEAPSEFASALDPAKAVKKSVPPSAIPEMGDDAPNQTEGDVSPEAAPEQSETGSPMEDADRDALIAEYERLSKKR